MYQSMKIAFILTINLLLSIPVYADVVEQKNLDFIIKPEELMKGDIHYYFSVVSPRKLKQQHPELRDLDSLSLLKEQKNRLILTKSVFVINKPVGFFDDKQMTDERFITHLMGEQKVSKLSPSSFKITVPGQLAHSYKMKLFFDADDLSTMPNSKITRAVTVAKKMDVIAQGASIIMFTEQSDYTRFSEGGVIVSSYIPLKETKTLVIQYQLKSVKKKFASKKILKPGILAELLAVKDLINNYK